MFGAASSASSVTPGSETSCLNTGDGAGYSPAGGCSTVRSYSGQLSTRAGTGMSATIAPSTNTRSARVSVTVPIAVPPTSHFSQSASTSSRCDGSTTQSIRSCDSEIMISQGSIPASRSGTSETSMSSPTSPLEAISADDEVSPAAPRSCSATSRPRSSSSSEHSMTFFSANGSPTWTVGRLAASSSPSSADASTEAPPIPSRPVEAPNSTSGLPIPAAAERISASDFARPRAIALTRQFCS